MGGGKPAPDSEPQLADEAPAPATAEPAPARKPAGVLNKPKIEAYIGASGSGKGVSINRRLAELQPARLLIWDPRNEYGKHARAVTSLAVLVRDFKTAGRGAIRVRYVPGGAVDLAEAFGLVCQLAFAAGDLVFVAEELSDVTRPSWAPAAWRRINTQGRHAGLHVLGAAQRPALIDKTFLANCTHVRCFQLGYDDDMQTMSKEVRAPLAALQQLATRDQPNGVDIAFLQYERRTRDLWAGSIRIRGSRVTEELHPFVSPEPQKAPAKRAKKTAPT